MRILVACAQQQEAEEIVAEVHRRAPGWQATDCSSAAQFERLVVKRQYEVVVLDLDLLEGAGLRVLERLAGLAADTYFIVVVPPGSQLLGARALGAGADYHLVRHDRWLNELLLVAEHAERIVSQLRQGHRTAEFACRIVELGTTIATDKELPRLLEGVGLAAISITDAVCCWIGVLDPEGRQFQQRYAFGDEATAAWETQAQDVAWRAVHSDELLVAQLDSPEGCPYRTVAVPVTTGGAEPVGAVVLVTPRAEPLTELHRNALQCLAALAAIILQNERLHHLAQQRAQQMEAAATQAGEEEARARTLLSAAVAVTETGEAAEVLNKIATNAVTEIDFSQVCIYLADRDHGILQGSIQVGADGTALDISDRSFPLKQGDNLLADAALGDAPYATYSASQIREAETSAAGDNYPRLLVPLRTHGKLMGVMIADNRESGEPISAQQTRLLRPLAGMASVALERIEVDKLRELFVSSISHELRAPLSSMQANNELVLDEEVGPLNQQQRMYLSRIDSAAQHIRRILDDLTDWSYLQAGKMSVHKQPVDVRETIRHATETLQTQANQAQVELLLALPEHSLQVVTDTRRLEQIIINLVDNAVKFNYHRGQVEVSAEVENQEVVIRVADTGPGIPLGLQDHIFEAFNRGSDEISRAVEGVGLGLAIATHMSKLLGGRISVESQLDHGSTFALHLPAASDNE